MVTVYDLNDVQTSSRNQLATILTKLVETLFNQDSYPDLIIDETWIFHNTQLLFQLLTDYPGNIEVVLESIDDFELFGIDPALFDSYSFHPSWSSELKPSILRIFGDRWEIVAAAIERCGINRGINGNIETVLANSDGTFKKEIFRTSKEVNICLDPI